MIHARTWPFLSVSSWRRLARLTHAPRSAQGGPAIQRSSSGGPSRFRGVIWHKSNSKWEARIYEAGKQRFLGYYTSEAEAARVYDEAALRLMGRAVNFPAGAGGSAGLGESLSRASSAPDEDLDEGEAAGLYSHAQQHSELATCLCDPLQFCSLLALIRSYLLPQRKASDACTVLVMILRGVLLTVCLHVDMGGPLAKADDKPVPHCRVVTTHMSVQMVSRHSAGAGLARSPRRTASLRR